MKYITHKTGTNIMQKEQLAYVKWAIVDIYNRLNSENEMPLDKEWLEIFKSLEARLEPTLLLENKKEGL